MTESAEPERCDFCRLPCPEDPVALEHEGHTYEFCSEACRNAMEESDRVFTEYRGYWRFKPGVSALDSSLPQGIPRNSFVLVSGQAGTRDGALHAELVWRTLKRGEPAVVMAFQEPPISVVSRFLELDWNVLPYLEDGRLNIVDCFTYRVGDRERLHDRMNDWNHHVHRVTEPATTAVRDPADVGELGNKLDSCLGDLQMVDTGLVLIDSLTEFGTLVQPVQAYNFVKDIRADVCKGRFVPIFAGATYTGESDAFPHDLGYAVDGVIDMELNGSLVEDTLIKRVRVRKMSGVLSYSRWRAYEHTAGLGLVTFDPREEMEKKSGDAGTDGRKDAGPPEVADEPGRGNRSTSAGGSGGQGTGAADESGAGATDRE